MAKKKSLKTFTAEVEKELQDRVGLGVEELGDVLIKDALDANETAEELVTWYIKKYDLREKEKYVDF